MLDPVLDAGLYARSGTRFYVFSTIVSGTGYRITTGICLYRIRYQYQILLSILFTKSVSVTRYCVLYFLLEPELGTGISARSQYCVSGFMPDPALGTRSQSVFSTWSLIPGTRSR